MFTTCHQCITRFEALQGKRVNEVYDVGNPARTAMGHAMYHASDGRTALCAAKRLPETN